MANTNGVLAKQVLVSQAERDSGEAKGIVGISISETK